MEHLAETWQILLVVLLLMLGYGFGRLAERRHALDVGEEPPHYGPRP